MDYLNAFAKFVQTYPCAMVVLLFLCFCLALMLTDTEKAWFRRLIFVRIPRKLFKRIREPSEGQPGYEPPAPIAFGEHDLSKDFIRFLNSKSKDRRLTAPSERKANE